MGFNADVAADEARVIRAALEVGGDAHKALSWFKNEPLPFFAGRTAQQLVRDGRTEDVLRYVASLAAGAAG